MKLRVEDTPMLLVTDEHAMKRGQRGMKFTRREIKKPTAQRAAAEHARQGSRAC
jgi:hypothetical protein